METTNRTLLSEAKEWLRSNWSTKRAVKCPCCTRNVQLREYTITDSTVGILEELWKLYGADRTFHLPTEVVRISMEKFGGTGRPGDVAMVRHWGLMRKVGKSVVVLVDGTEVVGTQLADYVLEPHLGEFLAGERTVPDWIHMFDGRVIDRSEHLVTVDTFRNVHVEIEDLPEQEEVA